MLTKSHVSSALKVLEDRGLITRKTDEQNRKHVEIHLQDSANEIIQDGIRAQQQFADDMFRGLSPEEIRDCMHVFRKVCENAEECIKNASDIR